MKSERKVVDAHPAKKRELLRMMKPKTLTDLILELAYPNNHKPTHRVTATVTKAGRIGETGDSWDPVQRCRAAEPAR